MDSCKQIMILLLEQYLKMDIVNLPHRTKWTKHSVKKKGGGKINIHEGKVCNFSMIKMSRPYGLY